MDVFIFYRFAVCEGRDVFCWRLKDGEIICYGLTEVIICGYLRERYVLGGIDSACISGSSWFWDEIVVASVVFRRGTYIPPVNAVSSEFLLSGLR